MKKIKAGKEWYVEKEASTSTRPYRLTFWCLKHFPRWLVNFITYCAALYFFVFDKRCRQESVRYQKNLKAYSPAFKKIKPLRQVATFAVTIVEKIDCWTNPIPFENIRFSDDDAQALTLAVFSAVITTTLLFWERRVGVAFIGVALLVGCKAMTLRQMLTGTELDIILFLVGMMIIVGVLKDLGFLTWVIQVIISRNKMTGVSFTAILCVLSRSSACCRQ